MISLTSPVRTRAHGWPAGPKLAGLCLATLLLFLADSLPVQAAALAATLGLYAACGGVFLREGLRRLRPLWPFLLIVGAFHLWSGRTEEGAVIVLRLVTAVGLANLVTMTTRLGDMIDVVRRLTAPLRRLGVSTRPLEIAIGLVIRMVPRDCSPAAGSWARPGGRGRPGG
ncbi:Cobalt transport protein [Wenxinia marina DSM 24838]|uniref:Cobalt transport protein n=1 Tax=Wenxinia marina DSM 24838 TaxID=1123501 RepID=A0A0D0QG81_9RHOB|nr:Cobalt transport protein [Wenxinia marina DSM 24838]